jgi:hypothetical protein
MLLKNNFKGIAIPIKAKNLQVQEKLLEENFGWCSLIVISDLISLQNKKLKSLDQYLILDRSSS